VRYLGIPASGVTTTAYRTVTDTTATNGQTTFTIPSYTVGYVDVFRNGVRLAAADFTATTGTTIVLASAASAGDTITTVSFYVSSVLNAIPATAGSISTAYLADVSVTQAKLAAGVAGNGPSFSVYLNATQNITSATFTKINFNTEEWDTANCFDNATNYRFTPNVAGYYQFNVGLVPNGSSITRLILYLYKNGTTYRVLNDLSYSNPNFASATSTLVYCNGSTDYVEMYGYITGTSPGYYGLTANSTYFQGFLARAA
jgi:hypothetical protein